MADEADRAAEYEQRMRDQAISAARAELPPGKPGECDLCGEWSGRLIDGACAPCRDRLGLG